MNTSKRLHPSTPQGLTGVINSDGSIEINWDSVPGAKSYLIHYADANKADAHDAKYMGYSESTTWTLAAADVPTLAVGDEIYLYVQSYRVLGEGADEIEKARYLHDGEFTGSAWSTPIVLTKQ